MAVMVQKHQMALFLLYLTSFVTIVNTRSKYFDTFCPSYGTKASKFLLYLTSTVLSVLKWSTYFDIFDPSYGAKASNGTIVAILTSSVATVHRKYIFWYIWPQLWSKRIKKHSICFIWHHLWLTSIKRYIFWHIWAQLWSKGIKWHSLCCIGHQMCSVCLNEVHILVYLSPVNGSYGQKASNVTVCAVFDILCGYCKYKKYTFWYILPQLWHKSIKVFAVFDINCAQRTHVLKWSTYFDTFGHSLVWKHQIAQFLHQLCSVCLSKVHILIHLTPVMVQKHQIAQLLLYWHHLWLLCIKVHILIYLTPVMVQTH